MIAARGSRRARDAIASLLLCACAPLEDQVFQPIELEPSEPVLVQEGALTIEIPVMLDHVPSEAVSLGYELVPGEAQNDCPEPDFEAAAGQVRFEAFETVALVPVFIRVGELAPVTIRIVDDDRGALLDAASFGVVPGTTADQAPALQAALAEALSVGRGVVVVATGDYELSSVSVPEGVTLSARGAVFHRPPRSADDLVSVRIEHLGSTDALPSLVEGASFDGRREEQGPYRDSERQDAHLVALQGDGAEGGRATASLERIGLDSGTASGVMVGPDVNVTLCGVRANELWRDAVTVVGGATHMRLRNLDATATEGTGLWIGPRHWGYAEDLSVDAEIEDVRIAAGDVELEATAGSRLDVRRLTMTEPPFRLDAPDGSVHIADSVLMLGIPSETHNFFGVPHDVSLDRTTLVVSERAADNGAAFEEQARTLVGVNVGTASLAAGDGPNLPGTLLFTDCHFELAADVEADDRVFAIDNRNPDVSVSVTNSQLGSGFVDLFGDGCVSCTSAP